MLLCSAVAGVPSSKSVLHPHKDILYFSGGIDLTKQILNGLLTLISCENSGSGRCTPWPVSLQFNWRDLLPVPNCFGALLYTKKVVQARKEC